MSTTAVSSQTAAAVSSAITVADGSSIKVWVATPLAQGESVDIIQTDGSSVEGSLIEYDEEERRPWVAQLTPGITALIIRGPGTYKLSKSVTASAVAVYYDS